jgi:predicted lipoprotein
LILKMKVNFRMRAHKPAGQFAKSIGEVPLLLMAIWIFTASGCSNEKAKPRDSFDRHALLASVTEHVALPAARGFAEDSAKLSKSVSLLCGALGGTMEAKAREEARTLWRQSMVRWQGLELLRFGPLDPMASSVHDQIYSWPIIRSSCSVDHGVQERQHNPAAFDIRIQTTNRRGLTALEYLLFADAPDHSCAANFGSPGARCEYAQVVAADVARLANELRDAWEPGVGDFAGKLTRAGESGSGFRSAQAAINAVSNAMFYLDTHTKDLKLAAPAGIAVNRCRPPGQLCPDDLESRYAQHSRENIRANLVAFRLVYTGNADDGTVGVGFDDFLTDLGAADFSRQLAGEIADALAAVDAISAPLPSALFSDLPAVVTSHAAIAKVCDQLKSRFLTVLGLELPNASAGDND